MSPTPHWEPEMRETIAQGETWNATWLARGPAGQTLVHVTASTSETNSAAIQAIGWNIYDQTSETEETPVASANLALPTAAVNADGGRQCLTAATVNGYSRTSAGHTVHIQAEPGAVSWTQIPGRTYRMEVELEMNSAAGGGYTKLVGHCYIRPWFGTE